MLRLWVKGGGKLENFKSIEYKGTQFLVGNLGTVLKNGTKLCCFENKDGYIVASHSKGNIGVHRLVAMCFIYNDDPTVKTEVHHKDHNRKNNKSENLEWVSHTDNIRYSAHLRDICGEKNPNYGNRKLSQYYATYPEEAIKKQGRPGLQNGRCCPVKLYRDGILLGEFPVISDCCDFLHKQYGFSSDKEVIRVGIRRSIKTGVPYRGYTFEKPKAKCNDYRKDT